jgi:hypothetical protein
MLSLTSISETSEPEKYFKGLTIHDSYNRLPLKTSYDVIDQLADSDFQNKSLTQSVK